MSDTRRLRPANTNGETPTARILVVDDEPSITDLLSTALRYMGYEVATARTGCRRLDSAAEHIRPTSSCST